MKDGRGILRYEEKQQLQQYQQQKPNLAIALSLSISSWEVKVGASGNSSSGKVPTVLARGPEFRSPVSTEKDSLVVCICNPSALGEETRGSLELAAQTA